MGNGKFVASLGSTALQHIPAIIAAHALTETMGLHFVPNIRLIRSFHNLIPSDNYTKSVNYSTFKTEMAIIACAKINLVVVAIMDPRI